MRPDPERDTVVQVQAQTHAIDGNLQRVAEIIRGKYPKAKIIIAADDDWKKPRNPGLTKAREAAAAIGARIAVPQFDELHERAADESDFNDLSAREGLERVREYVASAVRPSELPDQTFPRLDPVALYGLAGDIVRTTAPHTESAASAILAHFMVDFGSAVGPNPYYLVESTKHRANLYGLVVGETSKARKGTARDRVGDIFFRAFNEADPDWLKRIKSGLSSGEGVIYEVRDEVKKWNASEKCFDTIDPGVTDKRLLVSESEYGGALSVMERPGNLLSRVLRDGWDGRDLGNLTKNTPLKATGPHISIIGDITEEEYRRKLTSTDAANGYANRFLNFCARRSNAARWPSEGHLAREISAKRPLG